MPTTGNNVIIEEIVVTGRRAREDKRAVSGSYLSLETTDNMVASIQAAQSRAGTSVARVLETGTVDLQQDVMKDINGEYITEKGSTTVDYARVELYGTNGELSGITSVLYGAASGDLDEILIDTGETSATADASAYAISLGLSWKVGRQAIAGIAGTAIDYSYVCQDVSSGTVTYDEDTTDAFIGIGLGTFSTGDDMSIALTGNYWMPTSQVAGSPAKGAPVGNDGGAISTAASTFNGKVQATFTDATLVSFGSMNAY